VETGEVSTTGLDNHQINLVEVRDLSRSIETRTLLDDFYIQIVSFSIVGAVAPIVTVYLITKLFVSMFQHCSTIVWLRSALTVDGVTGQLPITGFLNTDRRPSISQMRHTPHCSTWNPLHFS
jgi:hypothetical protein